MTNNYSNEQLSEIYNHEIRNMIVRLLRIHNELSLAQLSEIMNMNKTTIQYHLKILREKGVIIESRESQEDSRGSIPTKYFQLIIKDFDYHVDFSDLKKISEPKERLSAYLNYLQSLNAGLKDIKNLISFAEEAIERCSEKANDLTKKKLTKGLLDDLEDQINDVRTSFSSFSTTKNIFQKIRNEIPDFYKKLEKRHLEEREELTEGYEIITMSIPLTDLLETRIKNKKRKWLQA